MDTPANAQFTPSSDDEVLVKQKDGSFVMVKMSELGKSGLPKARLARTGLMQSIPTPPKSAQPFVTAIQLYDQTAEKLIKQSGAQYAPDLYQRFKIVIISRLKDVRRGWETMERLVAPPLQGGIGLKKEDAEKVMQMVDEARAVDQGVGSAQGGSAAGGSKEKGVSEKVNWKIETPATPSVIALVKQQPTPLPVKKPVPQPPPSLPVAPEINASESAPSTPVPAQFPPKAVQPMAGTNKPRATSSDITLSSPQSIKIIPQQQKQPKVELAKELPMPFKPPSTVAVPQTPSGRQKVEDVSYKPRTMGPVEELEAFTLTDFRRLSPKPKVSADKICAKIELLTQEGYGQRHKGIQAWQKSPLMQAYRSILNESLEKGMPVAQVLREKKDTLSEEEFKVIMELNRILKY